MGHWQASPFILPLAVAGAVTAAMAAVIARRRAAPGARPLLLVMLAVTVWSWCYAVQVASAELAQAYFWSRLSYLGNLAIPPLFLVFALQFTHRARWLTRHRLALLAVEPVLTLLAVWTSPWLGLYATNLRADLSIGWLQVVTDHGPLYWPHLIYGYTLLALAVGLLLHAMITSPGLYRGQIVTTLVAALAPWSLNAVYIVSQQPATLDLTPFGFMISGLALTYGLQRYRMLDLVPVARDLVIQSLADAVLVVDAASRVVDMNAAAQALFGWDTTALGQPASALFARWPALLARFEDVAEARAELAFGAGAAQTFFDLRISPLRDRRGQLDRPGCRAARHQRAQMGRAGAGDRQADRRGR